MFVKLSTAALALAAVSMVSAQTSTDCNPTKEGTSPIPSTLRRIQTLVADSFL